MIDLTGLNIKNVLYVGIRIYSFGMAYANGCKIQHISEIGLYGGKIAGDVNGDGTVDTADLSSLRKYLLGIEVNENYVYDVNGDGKTDICDLVKLKKIFADIGN